MSSYSHSMPVHAPPSPVVVPGFPDGFVPNSTSPVIPGSTENLPRGFVPTPTMPTHDGLPPGFQPHSPSAPEGAPPGFMPSPAVQAPSLAPPDAPPGFVPDRPDISPGPPPGFIPGSPAPPGFVPGSPAPPGFLSASPAAPPGAPPGFVVDSSDQIPGAPVGFMPSSPMPDGAPPGFVPQSTSIPVSPLPVPITSPNMSVSGALPVLARSTSEKSGGFYDAGRVRSGSSASRSPRLSFSGPNAGFHSRAASDWDTRSAWGDNRTERSPRPVRGPDLTSPRIGLEPEIIRPGSSLSRRGSSPVIPDPVTFQPSRANSSRRGSRVGFGDVVDPSGVPLPLSTAPSFARSGRATSDRSVRANLENVPPPAVVRSQSARSDVSRTRGGIYTPNGNTNGMPTPSMGTPRHPSLSGLPPSGLGSPFSRRLDPHPEDADEYEVVASDVSQDTLTTPPAARRNLPRDRGTPAPPKRSLDPLGMRSPSANQTPSRRVSILAPADEPGPMEPSASSSALRRSASRQSIASNKSYSKFDPNEYVDPAVLTSGRSRLLPLPVEEPVAAPATAAAGGGKGRKNKKGKKK
ncbi:uncharacterized protein FOMMEDRAFT_155281 [Fomitiporia mediterranea MF3/22]|uniref:uncharacterized protein n=1 Tax=Fomitiporia mediterranea (strain MF3/22) TaxID=694068 RepID=UPI0004408688|nr:uncharacterized protein FOMMEDRAFT_155281 [Fomitiporia mediterranea MF3/22]EJD04161.1 hypothetical protein FOMMEDRAFT_155281 [Fomitiporia mediterranea MF3/22]